jgi:hypothetical protein
MMTKKLSVLFLFCFTISLTFVHMSAQNLGEGILGNGFTFDVRQSDSSSQSTGMMFDMMFGQMPGYSVETEIYRFNGSFDQAKKSINVPPNADVQPTQDQTAGMILGIFRGMFEAQAGEVLGREWLQQAEAKTEEWGSIPVKKYSFSVGRDKLMAMEQLPPGEKVSFLAVECSNPLLDLTNLEIVDGTWAYISKVTLVVPDMSADAGFLGGEDEDSERAMDPGVEVMPGSTFVDAEETSYDLAGELNWLIEKPIQAVVDFYLASSNRNCSVDSESSMYVDDSEVPYYSLYCLTHKGELKAGDDVIAVDITRPERGLLSEVVGRNQGTWTIISINRWVEEEY